MTVSENDHDVVEGLGRKRRTNPDRLSETIDQCEKIRSYWQRLGHEINVWIEEIKLPSQRSDRPDGREVFYAIRTDSANGIPSSAKSLTKDVETRIARFEV